MSRPSRWARSIRVRLESKPNFVAKIFEIFSAQFSFSDLAIPTTRKLFRRVNRSCLLISSPCLDNRAFTSKSSFSRELNNFSRPVQAFSKLTILSLLNSIIIKPPHTIVAKTQRRAVTTPCQIIFCKALFTKGFCRRRHWCNMNLFAGALGVKKNATPLIFKSGNRRVSCHIN